MILVRHLKTKVLVVFDQYILCLFNVKGRFVIQRQKETTGRVVFWNMGMLNSYTMEASYGGTNMGSRAFTHFTTDDYEGMGRYVLCVYGILTFNYISSRIGQCLIISIY